LFQFHELIKLQKLPTDFNIHWIEFNTFVYWIHIKNNRFFNPSVTQELSRLHTKQLVKRYFTLRRNCKHTAQQCCHYRRHEAAAVADHCGTWQMMYCVSPYQCQHN